MDWQSIGAGAAIVVALITGNAFVMKLIIDNDVTKLELVVSRDYVTKSECEKHREHCPMHKES